MLFAATRAMAGEPLFHLTFEMLGMKYRQWWAGSNEAPRSSETYGAERRRAEVVVLVFGSSGVLCSTRMCWRSACLALV
jgi:hypothetical protein